MGNAGVVTRLLASRFGSRWTYAGNGVAPGQVPAARMLERVQVPRCRSRTRDCSGSSAATRCIRCLRPCTTRPSRRQGSTRCTFRSRPPDFEDFDTFAAAIGIEGASVTIPFKLDALRRGEQRRCRDASRGRGQHAAAPRGRMGGDQYRRRRISRAAGGGVSRIAASASARRSSAQAARLGRSSSRCIRAGRPLPCMHGARNRPATSHRALGATAGSWPPPARSWDLLVNTTPLGGPALRRESPLPDGPFDGRLVYDLTYGPGRVAADCRGERGRLPDAGRPPMLVAQAERQFAWWTGAAPAPGVMRAAAERRVAADA